MNKIEPTNSDPSPGIENRELAEWLANRVAHKFEYVDKTWKFGNEFIKLADLESYLFTGNGMLMCIEMMEKEGWELVIELKKIYFYPHKNGERHHWDEKGHFLEFVKYSIKEHGYPGAVFRAAREALGE